MTPKWFISFLSMLVAVALLAVPASSRAGTLFEENFEGYPIGSPASDNFYAVWGGWQVTEEGGNKFFRSTSWDADYLLYRVQNFPGNVSIEFNSRSMYGRQQMDVGLTNKLIGHEHDPGAWQFYFVVTSTEYILYSAWTPDGIQQNVNYQILGTLPTALDLSIWHDVKMTLAGSLVKLYIDDSLVVAYELGQVIPYPIENFHTFWQTWGQRDLDNIKVTLGAKTVVNVLIGYLQGLLPSGDPSADHRIDKAIRNLQQSLTPQLWLDDSHLTDSGGKLFSEHKQAVEDLAKITSPPDLATALAATISSIVSIDRQLAETLRNDNAAGNMSELAKADEQLAMGDTDAAAGNFAKAVEHYGKAWEHARRAGA